MMHPPPPAPQTLPAQAPAPVAAAIDRGQRVPILVFGIDAADASHHTDTIMLSVFDFWLMK